MIEDIIHTMVKVFLYFCCSINKKLYEDLGYK